MNSTNLTYCDLSAFYKSYREYHTYISLFVCIFGSFTNILNIIVLTTKQMKSPTNFILTGLAVADLLVMVEYIPFVCLFNLNRSNVSHFTFALSAFLLFHALFTQAFHFMSCCLTIILAVWRYVAIKFPHNNNKWCNERRTLITIISTYLLCPFICIPLYLSLKCVQKTVKINEDGEILPDKFNTSLTENITYITYESNEVLKYVSFYVYGVVIKLIPCILLTILSSCLIVELLKAKERRRKLMNKSNESGSSKRNNRHLEKEKQADRTTRMLLAVLLMFLIAEFPQAIFGLLNHIVGTTFEVECYRPLGDILDIFALVNSSVNFVLYCAMSQKFREVFVQIFLPCKSIKEKWVSMQTVKTYV